jgi:phytoene dehydrogenase-like protein
VTGLPWYRDLGLAALGAQYIEPELNVALLREDGEALEWWTDFDRTAASFARFSPRDAQALIKWREAFAPIVREILIPEACAPPLAPDERKARLEQTANGRLLLEVSRLSPWEFVRQEFTHPTVQAGLLFFNGLREVDLRLPGFGHHIPALLAAPGKAQMCRGGSRRLAQALETAVQSGGGRIELNALPRRIRAQSGRAIGVETDDGRYFAARQAVVSSLNPGQTFLELLDRADCDPQWAAKAANFQYNLLAPLFGLYLNLDEPPCYAAAEKNPALARAFMVILGLEHVDQFQEIVTAHEEGRVPETVMWGACPTLFDPSQAPAGKHTAFMWEKLPFDIHGDSNNWHALADEHGEEMLAVWRRHAPNLERAVVDRFVRTPLDTRQALWNMERGDLLVGAFANGQVGYNRPFPGAGHYRTCLEGLYLCGSCCHPGGNVTGLPGYNCAQVMLADLGLS